VSKLPIAIQYTQIRDKSLFFQKKHPNACIYAKFFVILQRKMILKENWLRMEKGEEIINIEPLD